MFLSCGLEQPSTSVTSSVSILLSLEQEDDVPVLNLTELGLVRSGSPTPDILDTLNTLIIIELSSLYMSKFWVVIQRSKTRVRVHQISNINQQTCALTHIRWFDSRETCSYCSSIILSFVGIQ